MPKDARRGFVGTIGRGPGSGFHVALPFDPSEVWGEKERHHITGTVNGTGIRGPLERHEDRYVVRLGKAWCAGRALAPGERVEVVLAPEGPQRDALAPDVAVALDADPEAARAFDALATFYRKGWLTWIDATKRKPEVRAERIARMVDLVKAGHKQRPR